MPALSSFGNVNRDAHSNGLELNEGRTLQRLLRKDQLSLPSSPKSVDLAIILNPNFFAAPTEVAKCDDLGEFRRRMACVGAQVPSDRVSLFIRIRHSHRRKLLENGPLFSAKRNLHNSACVNENALLTQTHFNAILLLRLILSCN